MASVSAANMQRVVQARDHHNSTCPLGAATEAHLNPADIDRCGWEDGDSIAGLLVVADDGQPLGTLKVTCEGEGTQVALEDAVSEGTVRVAAGCPDD